MNDFVNLYLNRQINELPKSSAAIPAPNNSNNKQQPASQSALVEHSNPNFNQLAIGKTSYPDNQIMYSQLFNSTDKQGKTLLNQLSGNGKLLAADANDGSSTLQNLYKIMTTPRLEYFENKNILKETLKTLADPYRITQNFGKIPDKNIPALVQSENTKLAAHINTVKSNNTYNPDDESDIYPLNTRNIDFAHGNTCPAASIEFTMADKQPAEFVRFIEGLTSPEKSVKTKLKYADLSPNMIEALGFLTEERTDFNALGWNNIEVTIRPDENAYLRANNQEDKDLNPKKNHNALENYDDIRFQNSRSMVDVLMQSAFMQLGSRNTYNSLTDNRSQDTGGGKGLNQMEIAFVETIVDPKSRKMPVLYMNLDDDLTKVLNYSYDFKTTKKHFTDSLDSGKNIIVGFMTDIDRQGKIGVPSGHEILLTGYQYDQQGQLQFKYNDTDDIDVFEPSWISANDLIHTVHHANIPQSVLKEEIPQTEVGYLYLQDYKTLKQQGQNQAGS